MREYVLVINVDSNNNATVTTSISYPTGSALAVDLDHGQLIVNNEVVAAISSILQDILRAVLFL